MSCVLLPLQINHIYAICVFVWGTQRRNRVNLKMQHAADPVGRAADGSLALSTHQSLNHCAAGLMKGLSGDLTD